MSESIDVFACGQASFHPYECGGNCIHCKQEVTKTHNPKLCWLCLDGNPAHATEERCGNGK